MQDIYSYPALDLSLLKLSNTAVWCKTEEEARGLLAQVIIQYPENAQYYAWPDPEWDAYEDEMTYILITTPDRKNMTYADRTFFVERGYNVIPYTELILHECEDLGGFDSSDFTLNDLLG